MQSRYLKLLIVSFGILFSLYSCTKKENNIGKIVLSTSRKEIEERKNKVLSTGDKGAYDALRTDYLREKHYEEYLVYSLYMANKYKYPRAYYCVYYCITSIYERNHIPIDDESKEMALNYLKRGVALKEANALGVYGELLMEGKYVRKDSILGQRLYDESWK